MIKTKDISNFIPNVNPYRQDAFHMGSVIGQNVHIMFANHRHERCEYVILINTETGERVQVDFNDEMTPYKTIRVMLETEHSGNIHIGDILINVSVIGDIHFNMKKDASTDITTCQMACSAALEAEDWAYLYQVYENDDINCYYVETGKLYDDKGNYFGEITVGEKMEEGFLENVYMSFMEKVVKRWK